MRKNSGSIIYQAAIYIRLSREDGDTAESYSVTNQRMILEKFVNSEEDIILYDEYIDDGYTGTNFNRPDFQRMMRDIEAGHVNCVIVKDLSRFGRNHIRTDEYLQIVFPQMRVRFIAVTDNYDSKVTDGFDADMMLPMRNLFNEFHARDTSRKVQRVMHEMQREGKCVAAFVPYGYKKNPANKHELIPDEYAAGIVERIFDMYLAGQGCLSIAKVLNKEDILCPTVYKNSNGCNYTNAKRKHATLYWTETTVRAILDNEVYSGTLVQGKTRRGINCKPIKLPKDQWIRVPNAHEPIVSKEKFDRVQHLLEKNAKLMHLDEEQSLFAGYIKCADCGRAMARYNWKNKITYRCGTYKRLGKDGCSDHKIKMEVLEQIVRDDLNKIIQKIKNLDELAKDIEQPEQKHFVVSKDRIILDLNKWKDKKTAAYDDYREALISKEELLQYREKCDEQIARIEKQLRSIEEAETEQKLFPNSNWIDKLLKTKKIEVLDREIISEMIDEIKIYEDHTIEIIYQFSDELDYLFEKEIIIED